MATKESEIVKTIYLENHDVHLKVCMYNTSTGECDEVNRDELVDVEFWRGFYVSVDDKLVGIYASSNGPVLFVDQMRYQLKRGISMFSLTKKENYVGEFIFSENNEIKFQIEYTRPQFLEFDSWSTEEMADFFVWLTQRQDSERFYSAYTL